MYYVLLIEIYIASGTRKVQGVKAKKGFNDWRGRGCGDFVPGEVTKTAPSGDRTT